MFQTFLKQFANPGSQFRGKPFWAWNGKLEENELRRQVRIFHRMGLGGLYDSRHQALPDYGSPYGVDLQLVVAVRTSCDPR